ncbi:hypothetical protein E2C01_088220 [Portunus trituberculatus]|uniref:Uncharacterized protein n=1 Tax=Portunus trituberculatus TaxID=210409 RepID=A0A5B7J8L7_PORTR|nr:hypothetical protein [Portunus trituberculatus]
MKLEEPMADERLADYLPRAWYLSAQSGVRSQGLPSFLTCEVETACASPFLNGLAVDARARVIIGLVH